MQVATNDEDMYTVHGWGNHRMEELQERLATRGYNVTVTSHMNRDAYGNMSSYVILSVPHGVTHTKLLHECEKGKVRITPDGVTAKYIEVERFYGYF